MSDDYITIKIRPSNGVFFDIQIDPKSTVLQLKEKIAQHMENTSASQIKLVYSGHILKDDKTCSSYEIITGHTIHVVKSKTSSTSSPAASTDTTTKSSPVKTTNNNDNNNVSSPSTSTTTTSTTSNPTPGLSGRFPGFGSDMSGMPPGMPPMNPEAMRQMMDSPFMQGLLNNTEFVRSIIMSNPQMRSLVEENPEIGHVINDPAFLRQSIEMMRNPELMREAQRSNDRALSNIEALPGGFNHLRRMYSTLQDPLDSASRPNDTSSDEANERLARQLNVTSVRENTLNTQALPNPWAAPSTNTNNNNTNNSTNAGSNTSAPPNPFAALLGGSGSPSPFPFPFPGANSSSDANTSTTGNQGSGASVPFWADPNLAAQLQQSMMMGQQQQQQQQQPSFLPFMQNMFGNSNNTSGSTTTTTPSQPTEPPETRFHTQLGVLEEMGFSERQANIRALLATGGDVQAAIEYLLNH
ncbi:uncharacterized protein BX664DRAFT_342766 [Halteromyces radiatus]|uniref:uncharacterized protein n=1 Tax=Halteromyces radiatus TaxID=101107 RepID=UPI00221E4B44|nr:uncharacterized protein BX664DRAFT_342766 [Halteromyces radiatus]KAI8078814.1 hypothetical protein BX664DRAFT_342766 [Halteromyces radiatus]